MSEDRPPYVVFEIKAVEDRTASIESGHYVAKDTNYAIITPSGSKDRVEKIAEEWLRDLQAAVEEGRFPAQWLEGYRANYEAWKRGQEIPLEGTPLSQWPAITPGQLSTCLALNIRTVEDLASSTEEAMMRLGMGSRSLKDSAKAWLDSAKGQGKLAGELAALRTENAALKKRDEDREEQLKKLSAQVEALSSKE